VLACNVGASAVIDTPILATGFDFVWIFFLDVHGSSPSAAVNGMLMLSRWVSGVDSCCTDLQASDMLVAVPCSWGYELTWIR